MKHCGECGTLLVARSGEGGHALASCPACGWRWYNPPVPVTLVLVTTDEGNVVYTRKNSFEPWRWTVVAGFIERGETAEAAALREVKEETGLDSEVVRFMGTHVFGGRADQIVIAFHARVTGGTPAAGGRRRPDRHRAGGPFAAAGRRDIAVAGADISGGAGARLPVGAGAPAPLALRVPQGERDWCRASG